MPKRQAPQSTDARYQKNEFWYRAAIGDATVHRKVVAFGVSLRALYSNAHKRIRVLERLYEGTEYRRYAAAIQVLQQQGFNAARLNASKSVVNTLVSRLSKDRPMPSFVVNDADWSLKRRARQYRKFILGEMLENQFDELRREALLDGTALGNGFTRIDDSGDGDRVFAERVLREELLFDPRECKYSQPRNPIRVYRVARDRLGEMYPDFAKQIANAPASAARPQEELDDETRMLSLDDYVDVWEAHHLPIGDGDDTGRHALCIDGATLCYETWDSPRMPYAMYRHEKPRRGLWARGLMWDLKDIQHRVNCIVRDIQLNVSATGRGFFLQREDSAIPVEMLASWQPFSIKYKAAPPQWQAPQPFHGAQLEALKFFVDQMYELTGVSQAAAQSRSSLGPGASGVALDTQYDIDSERFAMQEAQLADYSMQAARLFIDASKRCAKRRKAMEGTKRSKAYVTSWVHRDAIEQLEHDDVALEDKDYKLQLEPINSLPTTRGGKLSEVGQLAQAGIIPQWLVQALFDEPDLMRASRITLGAFYNAERKMELLADPDKPMPVPMPYNDLELELKMTVAYLNYSEAENAPPEVIDRYVQYMDMVQAAIDKKNAATMPPGGAGPGAPPMPAAGPGSPIPASLPGAQPMVPPGAPMPTGAQ